MAHFTKHQGNARSGETAGIQCTSNGYFAIIFSVIKKVLLWKAIKINYVLDKANTLFISQGIHQPLAVNELPHVLNIEGYNIRTDFLYKTVIHLGIMVNLLNILGI